MTTPSDPDGADLRATMDRALHDLTAPEGCGPAAITAGHRIRARRRAGYAVSGIAAVAAIGALSLPAIGGGGGTAADDTTGYAATTAPPTEQSPPPDVCGSGTPSAAENAPGSEQAAPDGPPPGWWDLPAAQVLDNLRSLLPETVTMRPATSQTGYADGTLIGPDGPGSFQLMLRAPVAPVQPEQSVTSTDADGNTVTKVCSGSDGTSHQERLSCRAEDPDWAGEFMRCELIRDDTGAKIGAISTERDRGTTYHNITLVGPDGGAIYFYVADSTGEKPGDRASTADRPPLTFAEVKSLVQDPAWTRYQP